MIQYFLTFADKDRQVKSNVQFGLGSGVEGWGVGEAAVATASLLLQKIQTHLLKRIVKI